MTHLVSPPGKWTGDGGDGTRLTDRASGGFEHRMSRLLGISRKASWERRQRLGIPRTRA
ncbi:MAG TPA: hypothetical protein VEZ71_22125 [Archangium sp.]|nr:hypothetical protein [Archangium sp.]